MKRVKEEKKNNMKKEKKEKFREKEIVWNMKWKEVGEKRESIRLWGGKEIPLAWGK